MKLLSQNKQMPEWQSNLHNFLSEKIIRRPSSSESLGCTMDMNEKSNGCCENGEVESDEYGDDRSCRSNRSDRSNRSQGSHRSNQSNRSNRSNRSSNEDNHSTRSNHSNSSGNRSNNTFSDHEDDDDEDEDDDDALIVDFPSQPRGLSFQGATRSFNEALADQLIQQQIARGERRAAAREVRFSVERNTHHPLTRDEFEAEARREDFKESWYSKRDYKKFKKSMRMEVMNARRHIERHRRAQREREEGRRHSCPDLNTSSDDLGGDDYTVENSPMDPVLLLGLESFLSSKLAMRRMRNQQSHAQAVLEEHRRQAQEIELGRRGAIDQKALRRVSEEFSEWGKQRAMELGRVCEVTDDEEEEEDNGHGNGGSEERESGAST